MPRPSLHEYKIIDAGWVAPYGSFVEAAAAFIQAEEADGWELVHAYLPSVTNVPSQGQTVLVLLRREV